MKLSNENKGKLLETLQDRFEKNKERHPNLAWDQIVEKLEENQEALQALYRMEETGGEPDVVELSGDEALTFYDCAKESPKGRVSLCYDDEALQKRKANKPAGSAVEMAKEIGAEILTEDEYRALQEIFPFDLKTSSWVHTPDKIRKLGGALFCDRRYDTVFVFHNGADSYYSSRGFRAKLKM